MKAKMILFLLFLSLIPLFSTQKMSFTAIKGSFIPNITFKVMEEAYRRLGIEISIKYFPAKRALYFANKGVDYDGELHRISGIEKTYTNLLPIPIPIYYLEGVVVAKDVEFDVNGWDSLRPYKIGVKRGIVFSVKGTEGMSRDILNSNEHLFKLLNAQRFDIIIITRANALKYFKDHGMSNFKILEPPVIVKTLYHYVHKKNSHLIPKLTSVLKDMQKEGTIKKINDDYIKNVF